MNRLALVAAARRIVDDAERQGRELTAAEQAQVDELWRRVDATELPPRRLEDPIDAEWTLPPS